ncbi:MAG: hypothetical protein EPO08_18755 [Rhodospirillaceae bacterium]|nr:MAG: hypothetical protein EPO08_18755 [Rhodospirillaceae bacterium]
MKRCCRVSGVAVRLLVLLALMACPATGMAGTVPLAGLSYSPSGIFTYADLETQVDDARMRTDLTQLSAVTKDIRTYTVARTIDHLPAIAASLGMKVTMGVWLSSDKARTEAEIANAIAVVKADPKAIARVIVGNETVQRGEMDADGVAAAMATVRRGIAGTGIPVGTAEIWYIWLANPKLAAASDFIAVHIIPYWDGVTVDDAPAYVAKRYDEIAQRFPGKPIVIGETGWPSSGPVRQGAVPSPENEARFVNAFAALARTRGYTYFVIEAYDQPWKTERGEDPCSWGIFDVRRTPKIELVQLNQR